MKQNKKDTNAHLQPQGTQQQSRRITPKVFSSQTERALYYSENLKILPKYFIQLCKCLLHLRITAANYADNG